MTDRDKRVFLRRHFESSTQAQQIWNTVLTEDTDDSYRGTTDALRAHFRETQASRKARQQEFLNMKIFKKEKFREFIARVVSASNIIDVDMDEFNKTDRKTEILCKNMPKKAAKSLRKHIAMTAPIGGETPWENVANAALNLMITLDTLEGNEKPENPSKQSVKTDEQKQKEKEADDERKRQERKEKREYDKFGRRIHQGAQVQSAQIDYSIETRDKAILDQDLIKARNLVTELEQKSGASPQPNSQHQPRQRYPSSPRRNFSRSPSPRTCHRCGKEGHFIAECPQPRKTSDPPYLDFSGINISDEHRYLLLDRFKESHRMGRPANPADIPVKVNAFQFHLTKRDGTQDTDNSDSDTEPDEDTSCITWGGGKKSYNQKLRKTPQRPDHDSATPRPSEEQSDDEEDRKSVV